MRLTTDLTELESSWIEFLELVSSRPIKNYHYHFPQELIDSLAKNVHNGCIEIGLASYIDQQKETERPILAYCADIFLAFNDV